MLREITTNFIMLHSYFGTITKRARSSRRFSSTFGLTHVGANGAPCMVDVSSKESTSRTATAQVSVYLPKAVDEQINLGEREIMSKKGPVFSTAIVAGVMACKKTSDFIPFCHPIPIDSCKIDVQVHKSTENVDKYPTRVDVIGTVKTTNKTGVEMEALMAVNVAALTIYDMLKALSHDIIITDLKLMSKTGGKSGEFRRND